MISNNLDSIQLDKFPVIIFGSGPAGISTALELEKKNINSIIIEAGNENYSEISQDFYKGKIIGDQIMPLSESRLRQFGGTSGLWGGTCKPLEDYTFDLWPINNNDLKPYLDRACEILDIKNQFRKTLINKSFSQIEFQTSRVKFAEKYKNHLKGSDKIALVLNTQLSYLVGENNNISYAICHSDAQEKKNKR